MRSRMASSRGPQRVLGMLLALVVLAGGFHYWRLRTVNADLTDQLVRLEGLLQAAEVKSSKIEEQRQDVGDDLKKVNANLQQLQITKDEEVTKCKHIQENLEQLEETRAALQKELDDEKDNQDRELGDMARKLKALQAQLTESQAASRTELQTKQQELERTRHELARAGQASGDAVGCQSQLAQVQSQLAQCQSVASAAGQAAIGQAAPTAVADGSRAAWPGLKAPRGQLGQQLFKSAGLSGFQQAQGRAGLAPPLRRVLPAPPGGLQRHSSSSSSLKPPVAQEMLAKPQSKEEAVEGVGVLRQPPQEAAAGAGSPLRRQEQLAPPQAERPGQGEEPNLGLDDVNLQYPNEGVKDAMDDHPDTDQEEVKDAALIKGLLELSNKSGRQEDLAGPAPDIGGQLAPEMVGAVGAPELTAGQQPPLPLR